MISIKKYVKKLAYKIYAKKPKDIYPIIEYYDYISFDIFDTLIKRNINKPREILKTLEIDNFNFYKKRIKAEADARKNSSCEEITLNDIYQYLEYDDKTKQKLMELEIETEKKFCTTNQEIYELYKYSLEHGKTIFITSDMYLPKKTVEEILKENGYTTYRKLYLSSEYKQTKHTGHLFQTILKEQNIDSGKLLHIGDTWKSDFISPRKLNIKSILLNRETKNCQFQSEKNKTLDYQILSSFINNHIDKNKDSYQKLGYEILGPILYGYTSWLYEQIKKDKIEKIYFLARDAKIIMEVYEKRYGKKIPIHYLHISRKAVVLANLQNLQNFDDLFTRSKSLFTKVSTVKDMLHLLNIKGYCPHESKMLSELNNIEKQEIFNKIHKEVENYSSIQNKYFKKYLKQENFSGRVAIVDIGWNGTSQYYLNQYIDDNTKLYGYYIGIYKSNEYLEYNHLHRQGYLFNQDLDMEFQSIISLNLGIFETLFLSTEESTIGYQEQRKIITPIYGIKDNTQHNITLIQKIQDSAKAFVNDADKEKLYLLLNDSANEIYFENYKEFIINPKLKNIRLFNNINIQNVYQEGLIQHQSLMYYIFHMKQFYIDFRQSTCKVMFLKDIFKISLPYYKILKRIYIKSKSGETNKGRDNSCVKK